ncbi:hypothetical protein E3T54_02855 [Cryobacterium sp. Sr8]|uniref:hypothetical protein n=1 Tax=Cryobacterium sp. Sr8 TaxID=1259203 RepID=UPI001069655D|nr:hypothetical protein [Cryobacterium sp. Sr8]TFD80698.1 hypothetical protein E3T54_02855 [Cryobacterium sp. Sr8]
MAKIEIESAFVEDWNKSTSQHPAWGMKTAEAHSKKNVETNKYETQGRTFRTVKVSRESGIDLTEYTKGDRVHVWGTESTVSREFEGKTYYELIVWADRIERAEAKGAPQQAAPAAAPPAPDLWNAPGNFSDETPF